MRSLLLGLVGLCLVACASTRGVTARQIVGQWRYADEMQSCRYVFAADGTFHGEVAQRDRVVSRFSGVWSLNNHTLSYRYLADPLGLIPRGATDHDELLKVERDAILIRTTNGAERKYVRMP